MPWSRSLDVATRALLIGSAAGARASFGVGVPILLDNRRSERSNQVLIGAVAGMLGEMVWDQLPNCPSRLEWPGLASRIATGAGGALIVARSVRAPSAVPAMIGAIGALGGAIAGFRWRQHWSRQHPAWTGGVIEDGAALAVAVGACRRG